MSVLLIVLKICEVWSVKHEADSWSPFNADVINASNYTCNSTPAYVFMTWWTLKYGRSACVEIHLITCDKQRTKIEIKVHQELTRLQSGFVSEKTLFSRRRESSKATTHSHSRSKSLRWSLKTLRRLIFHSTSSCSEGKCAVVWFMGQDGRRKGKGLEKEVITFLSGWMNEKTPLEHECWLHRFTSDSSMCAAWEIFRIEMWTLLLVSGVLMCKYRHKETQNNTGKCACHQTASDA